MNSCHALCGLTTPDESSCEIHVVWLGFMIEAEINNLKGWPHKLTGLLALRSATSVVTNMLDKRTPITPPAAERVQRVTGRRPQAS